MVQGEVRENYTGRYSARDQLTQLDVAKRNVHKPDDLTTWLGIRRLDQVDDTQCHLLGVAEKDPKCRLM